MFKKDAHFTPFFPIFLAKAFVYMFYLKDWLVKLKSSALNAAVFFHDLLKALLILVNTGAVLLLLDADLLLSSFLHLLVFLGTVFLVNIASSRHITPPTTLFGQRTLCRKIRKGRRRFAEAADVLF